MKITAALVVTLLALLLPAVASAATVGTKTVHAHVAAPAPGVARVYAFKAGSSGVIDRLSVYLDASSTARRVNLGLYAGSASRPRMRRRQCLLSNPRPGAWDSCAFTAVHITAGASYWLAVLQP